ncbi:MAG: c-type cytochrome biogenesis protein CcmI [Bauldia sp.]
MGVLTALAALALLVPLFRGTGKNADPATAGAIYRDQLAELEADVARGAIGGAEAEAARAEISRRLLKTAAAEPASGGEDKGRQWVAAGLILVAAPLVAVQVYRMVGLPNAPDQPLQERLTGALAPWDEAAAVRRAELQLEKTPDDARLWGQLAQYFAGNEDYGKAVNALRNLVRIQGDSAPLETAIAMSLMREADGTVTDAAVTALRKVVELDPKDLRPRFFLALRLRQDGKTDEAAAAWRAILPDAPAPLADLINQQLAELEGRPPPPPTAPRGPTDADVAAVRDLPPDQQKALFNSMVERLAGRLAEQPDDADGWTQLIRSYVVLGRTDDAKQALARARVALAARADRLAGIETLARTLDLTN